MLRLRTKHVVLIGKGTSMIKHVWSVLCSKAILDKESNNFSLINVLEQINLRKEIKLPAVVPIEFHLVTLWMRESVDKPAKGQARVILKTPSNETLEALTYEIDLESSERHRANLTMHGLPISEVGYYYFQVKFRPEGSARWKTAAQLPLKVTYL